LYASLNKLSFISTHNINYVYNRDEMRLLRGTIPIFKYNLGSLGGFSRPPLTAEAQVRAPSVHMRFVIDTVAMG